MTSPRTRRRAAAIAAALVAGFITLTACSQQHSNDRSAR